MSLVTQEQQRRIETPNAVMTTLASPTVGATRAHALWRVRMDPGKRGPLHAMDAEQIWTVLDGGATIELGEQTLTAVSGETIVMPAGALRRVVASADAGFEALVAGPANARATLDDGSDRGVPPWIA